MNTPQLLPGRRSVLGFTLTELLLSIAILAILLAIAVPMLGSYVQTMKLTALSNTLLSQLHMARSEAIKRNGRVALCKSGDGRSCASTGGWEQGWIVFDDPDNDGVRAPSESLIWRVEALPGGFVLLGNQSVSRYVSFTDSGGTRLASGAFQAGTMTLCRLSNERTEARQIVINAVGRPRIQKASVDSCASA